MQQTLGDRIVSIIVGTLKSLVPSGITDGVRTVVDFAYVRVLGLPFIIIGYRQTGKTTLLEWLRRDTSFLVDFDPEPTAAGGDSVYRFSAQVGHESLLLKPKRDVGGEYAMWETDWMDLFLEAKPRGIIFMIDHTNPYQHKDALNFALQMIDEHEEAGKNLKTILLLINKSDLWEEGTTVDTILEDFRNENRRLKSQAERKGYSYTVATTSLLTGDGVEEALKGFFNTIRPRSKKRT